MKNLTRTLVLALLPLFLLSQESTRLLRFPDISDGQIAFSYAGDLYLVDENGGTARKITTDEGYEMFPRFSPDGKQLAFTGQYDGNTEVYLMKSDGSEPTRLSYTATLNRDEVSDRMGPNNIVMDWKPNGEEIVFRSRKKSFNAFVGQLYSISAEGGMEEQLPLSEGGFLSFNDDGSKMAYNQVFREFRTWKYYKGGMADDIWIYDFETQESQKITDNPAQDIIPMWHGNTIYFASDRDRTMNIFAYDRETEEVRKVTDFTKYDVKFPAIGENAIVFENGGYIYRLDLEDENYERLDIHIKDDRETGRKEWVDASEYINSANIAPDGKRVVFGARGDIFTVPANKGFTRNLTQTPGAHDRNAVWSPDGKHIAYLSDKSGEYEIYIVSQDGSTESIALTEEAETYKFKLQWSPDSKKLLWNDKKMRLRYVNIESKEITEVAHSKKWEITNFDWSPDSKWISYSKRANNDLDQLFIYDLENDETHELTDTWYHSSSPEFSANGKYLFFTSKRSFDPIYSETEWNHAYRDMSKIYLITLAEDTPSPFAPENDEVNSEDEEKDKQEGKDIQVDIEGIKDRITVLPVEASNYGNLSSVEGKLYYNEKSYSDKHVSLKMFDIENKKEQKLGNSMSFSISSNGKKMLVKKGKNYAVIDLPSSEIKLKDKLDMSGMEVLVDKRAEWAQIFEESWRQMRDFFYDPGLHGVDWQSVHDKYKPLVKHARNRHDLNYIIGEMIGELNVGHAYVNGGDRQKVDKVYTGLLGAEFEKDESGYFTITNLLQGENWRKNTRSPLTEIGVNLQEGDYILSVNGNSLEETDNIYKELINKTGNPVELQVNDEPSTDGSRKVLVEPIKDESNLYYFNWVRDNIEKVNEATDGQVGYIHVPNMITQGLNEFVKYFYPQLNKKALIIDDRGNGGGNVSPMLIERLKREITRANMARNVEIPSHTPSKMMLGPKVLLIDKYSASDGDLFPFAFKKHDMGTVIGERSWGGVVGIRGSLPFIDGADMRKPEYASYSAEESKWIIEGHGVEPDIEVHNDPHKEFRGKDKQLQKAIEVALEKLKEGEYKELPEIPEFPDKSGEADK
ncbi:MAG: PDZ domain-containing protein [Bacteroidales bacterium]|nr:PDZ domain-containing protein [Bacteroidales bacterium]